MREVFLVVALGAVYFGAAKVGLSLAFVHASATAIWPPTGIATAAVLLLGYRVWPGIALGAFLANLSTEGDWATSLTIAFGNTLEAVATAWLVNRWCDGRECFRQPATIFRYIVLAGAGTMISPTIGVTSLALESFARWENYGAVWVTWWLGDFASAVILAPLLIVRSTERKARWSAARIAEGAALGALVLLIGFVAFGSWLRDRPSVGSLSFLYIPPMVWAALRFGLRATVVSAVTIDVMATWGTLHGFGPFAAADSNTSLLLVQAFMCVVSVTSLVLAASLEAQHRIEADLLQHRDRLEDLVRERTEQLAVSHEQLRLSERMSALGTLAAGIGHDMGNPLLPMRVQLDSLKDQGLGLGANEDIDGIGKCVDYLNRLTKSLRLLALDPDKEAAGDTTNLRDWWGETAGLLGGVVPRHVRLECRLPDSMIVVRMSSAGFSQIMFNLFQNAADAVRDCRSGLITLWAEADSDAAFVRVGVTDNGSGMSEEVKRRCLEPFFTTKTRGISTGLGLSLVHSLAERAGGTTEIDSTPGVGTTFVLRLPAVVTTSQAKEPPAGACRG